MKGAMPLDKTLPLWDITAMPNFQMKYPLSRKRKVSQMRRTSLKAPLREGGQLAQACSKRRGENAKPNGFCA